MLAYPLVVVVINALFGFIVGRQYIRRRHPYQLVWTLALGLGFFAALFYVMFLALSDNADWFKLYYICGALLMAAYLGLGSIYLHAKRPVADMTAAAVSAVTVLGILLLLTSGTDPNRLMLAAHSVGPGTNAIFPGPWKAAVAVMNIFGALAVFGGAVYSAVQTVRRRVNVMLVYANVLIAVGTFLAALAGTAADQGSFAGSFWLILAAGFVVLFAGFLLTTRGHPTGSLIGTNPTKLVLLPSKDE